MITDFSCKYISYAQNFEDVMLWRALKHVSNGFYIDVGADDPYKLSITYAFYTRGWSGMNIEPVPEQYSKFVKDRQRDINLKVLAGITMESRTFLRSREPAYLPQMKTLQRNMRNKLVGIF